MELFFDTIKDAKNGGHDIVNMSTKQWYTFLLQHDVTLAYDEQQLPLLRPCRAELVSPTTKWADVWARVRLTSLKLTAFC